MFKAASESTLPVTVLNVVPLLGWTRVLTTWLLQVRAPVPPAASNRRSRLPEMVLVANAAFGEPDEISRFLIARQSRDGSWALSSAAAPVTCGVAIEVPLNTW